MKRAAAETSEQLLPTRYSLLSRLQNRDDQESWKDFFDSYWHLIYSLAIKSGLTPSEAEEVVQETVICVARDIHKFKRDRQLGSFKGWLRKIIRWRITDQFRKKARGPAAKNWKSDEEIPELEDIPDPSGSALESLWQEEWDANLLHAAIERVKRKVKEEHYQIFHLSTTTGWPAQKVAETMQVSVGKVYLIKHRVASLIKKEMKRLEKSPL